MLAVFVTVYWGLGSLEMSTVSSYFFLMAAMLGEVSMTLLQSSGRVWAVVVEELTMADDVGFLLLE